jgi:WD40 repeat protein
VLRTLKRTSSGYVLRFNPNGRILVSDGLGLELWDVATGTLLRTLPSYSVSSTAFSPDSKTLAGVDADHTIKIWDVATGTLLSSFKSSSVTSIAFSPDGKVLAGGGTDGIIKLWNVSSGAEMRTLKGIVSRDKPGFSATVERMPEVYYDVDFGFSPAAGGRVGVEHATASAGREFAVVHMEVKPPPGMHQFLIKDPVLYDSAGRKYSSFVLLEVTLSRLSKERKADFAFEVPKGAQLKSLKFENYSFDLATQVLSVEPAPPWVKERHRQDEAVSSLAFSSDGKTLASGGFLLVKLWDVSSGVELRALEGSSAQFLTFSPDGKNLFLISGRGASVPQWDVSTGTELAVINATDLVFRPDGRVLAAAIKNQDIQLRDLLTGADLPTLKPHGNRVRSIALSSDGKTFASGGDDVKLWDLANGGALRRLTASRSFVVGFSPDGKTVASENTKGGIDLFNVPSGTLLRSLGEPSMENHPNAITSIAFSPDNKTFAAVRDEVELWDVSTGKKIKTMELAHPEPICLAFSPDGKTMAIGMGLEGDAFFGVELRNVSSGKLLRSLAGHAASVQSVTFSPDGKTVASGGWDGIVKLWNVTTGVPLRTLKTNFATSLAFSPDGKIFASDDRSTVKLWSVKTGRELRTFKGHFDSVSSISFSANGKYVLSGSQDSSVKLWEVSSGKELATLIALDEHDWLVVTPEGLFDGSPDAWNKILWRFNHNTFDHAPVEAFFNEFYYPGLLADIFAGKRPRASTDISQKDRRQPQLRLTTASNGRNPTVREGARNIAINIDVTESAIDKDHKFGSGAQDVRLFRNGSLVKVWHGDVLKGQSKVTLEATIPIVTGENKLTAYAFNHDNIKSSDATLVVNGGENLRRQATAYILAIGVNNYSNSQYNLKYAVADAEDFSAEVKRQQESLKRYAKVEVISLSDAQATKANITQKLSELATRVQPEDAMIVFFAGHGTAQGNQFYLIPHDLGYDGPRETLNEAGLQTILAHSISDRELEKLFEGIDAGQLLLVIDACNSGQALEAEEKRRGPMNSKGLAQLAYEKGMYVLTAAQSYQAAQEAAKFGHGFLTYALVEDGLKQGKADREPKDRAINLREWLNYATEQVPRMQEENMLDALRGRSRYVNFRGDGSGPKDPLNNIQRPRIFYRRELDSNPLVIAVLGTASAP